MALNTRDTSLRRFSTYIWGTALMLAVCIVAILLAPLFSGPPTELEDDYYRSRGFDAKVQEVHETQAAKFESYEYDPKEAAINLFDKANKDSK